MTRNSDQQALLSRMHEVMARRADHTAVREQKHEVSYAEFGHLIGSLHQELAQAESNVALPIGLLLDRSALAYAAMWASISHGRAYVPLNTIYPPKRLRNIVKQADISTVICEQQHYELALLLGIDAKNIVVASRNDSSNESLSEEYCWWQANARGDIAYLLFTSGSTGQPKGVPISYGNLRAFIENMDSTIPYTQDDVCSQVCELSFDLSVHEIYLALLNGCVLCPANRIDLFNPAQYIAGCSITILIAVPSLARVILNNGVPINDSLHSVRLSIFNGEALTAEIATTWHEAAPSSDIWNTYGPTECTVAVTAQLWADNSELTKNGVVAIGAAFPDCETALLNETDVRPTATAPEGSTGELLLATPQRFSAYSDQSLATPFVNADSNTFYRTGDRVLWRAGKLFHLGRIDHQVKIGGHRIELLEIEHRLRRSLATESLAVIAAPAVHPTELVLFISGITEAPSLDLNELGLPAYMLPKRIILLDALPMNPHGKLDRSALLSLAVNRV